MGRRERGKKRGESKFFRVFFSTEGKMAKTPTFGKEKKERKKIPYRGGVLVLDRPLGVRGPVLVQALGEAATPGEDVHGRQGDPVALAPWALLLAAACAWPSAALCAGGRRRGGERLVLLLELLENLLCLAEVLGHGGPVDGLPLEVGGAHAGEDPLDRGRGGVGDQGGSRPARRLLETTWHLRTTRRPAPRRPRSSEDVPPAGLVGDLLGNVLGARAARDGDGGRVGSGRLGVRGSRG